MKVGLFTIQAKPLPTTVAPVICGMPELSETSIRATVHGPVLATLVAFGGRLSTFETKIDAFEPLTEAVRSHGPLM